MFFGGRNFTGLHMYFVYVIQSEIIQHLYIGFTEDPKARLAAHNKGDNISTHTGRPWRLIYLEAYLHKQDALNREKFLKSGSGHRYINKQLHHFLTNS